MATIETGVRTSKNTYPGISTDESIGAMLFDTSGFINLWGNHALLQRELGNENTICINSMDDLVKIGLDQNFMNSLPYYHISYFYEYLGKNQPLYICFADCSESWEIIQKMQRQANGKLFHIGIWTSQPIWTKRLDESVGFTDLIPSIQLQADEINGKIGKSTHSLAPLNLVLVGNTNNISNMSFRDMPDAKVLDCAKVSVVLGQNGADKIHQMQERNPLNAPVGVLGAVMACLTQCGAEESIASAQRCDLNVREGFNKPELGFGNDYTPIDKLHQLWFDTITSAGYIIPVSYEGLEGQYFFGSDTTLGNGDFGNIANNRVMHKCRRAAGMALLPYINSNTYISETGAISNTSIAMISTSIYTLLDSTMRNRHGQMQINDRQINFINGKEDEDGDVLYIKLDIEPVNYNSYISEMVSHNLE